jgi:hypothetical protein
MNTPDRRSGPTVLNPGTGVDTLSLLNRWMREAETRSFDLDSHASACDPAFKATPGAVSVIGHH